MTQRKLFVLIIVLFAFSGIAGLIYQVSWFKSLSYFIGNTSYAQSILLATYMLGLAIGAKYWGKKSDETKQSIRLFAILEIIIGVYCLFYNTLFDIASEGLSVIAISLDIQSDSSIAFLLKTAITVLLILPPTILMGGTLPILVKFLSKTIKDVGKNIATLYFINSLGAFLGSLLAGFFLLESLGIANTLYLAAALDIIIGIIAYWIYRQQLTVNNDVGNSSENLELDKRFSINKKQYKVVLFVAGISGLIAMAYEIIWLRLLIPILSSSTYSFTIILTTFILGITLGSLIVSRIIHRIKHPYILLGWCQFFIFASLALTLPFYERLPYYIWNAVGDPELSNYSYDSYLWTQFYYVFLLLIIPTIFMGMSLPLATRLNVKDFNHTGDSVGRVFSINTIGTVAGSLLIGLIIIPIIGMYSTIVALLILTLILASTVFYTAKFSSKKTSIVVGVGAILSLVIFFGAVDRNDWVYTIMLSETPRKVNRIAPPEDFSEFLERSKNHDEIHFIKEGANGTFVVAQHGKERYLFTNGKGDANSVGDLRTQVSLGLTPVILHDSPQDVFVIGFGAGTTIGHVLTHSRVKNGVVAEISQEVIEAGKYFNEINEQPLNQDNLKIIEDDGISALRMSGDYYDVIISQPSNPWAAGVGNLFTQEFFATCKQHLKKGGVVAQWFNLYEMDDRCLSLILRTARSQFEHITLWQIGKSDIMLMCSEDKQEFDLSKIKKQYELSAEQLKKIGIHDFAAFLSQEVNSDYKTLDAYIGDGPLNTEDLPLLEHWAPRAYYNNSRPTDFYPLDERKELSKYSTHVLNKYKELNNGLTNDEKLQIALFQSTGGSKELAFELANEHPYIYTVWAEKARRLGNEEKAKEYEVLATQGILTKDTIKSTYEKEAYKLATSGDLAGAVEAINKAIDEDEANAKLHYQKGTFHLNLNQLENAKKAFERSLQLNPNFLDSYINLSITYGQLGEYKKVITLLNQADKLSPNNPQILYNRGNAKGLLGDFNGAISDFDTTIKIAPNHGQAFLNRANAYLAIRNAEKACSDLNKAYSLGVQQAAKFIQQYCNN